VAMIASQPRPSRPVRPSALPGVVSCLL
jgi:hypothetical protein